MLLANFREVINIDQRISKLHRELSALYEERIAITTAKDMGPGVTQTTLPSAIPSTGIWERDQYEILHAAWMKLDVKIPTYKVLQSKLASTKAVIANLPQKSDGQSCFELFLVPPTATVASAFDGKVLSKHQTINYEPFSVQDLPKAKAQRQWKLMVVYSAQKGLPVNNYDESLKSKEYTVNGYGMSGLNVREYGLYALLKDKPIDVECWSLLPAASAKSDQVACAGFIGKQYRCVIDDTRSLIGTNSFRPAMEIA